METLEMITDIAVIVTAVVAVITLILNIIKQFVHSNPAPMRRKLEYVNDFGDFIVNNGRGVMKIDKITYYYCNEQINVHSLAELYIEKLNYKNLQFITYLTNEDIIGLNINSGTELRLVEINPQVKINITNENLLNDLYEIRKNIMIKITYKTIYGWKKTAELK